MPPTLGVLLADIAGCLYLFLGIVHGVETLRDPKRPGALAPMEEEGHRAMRESRVGFAGGRTSIWLAWIGFNLSHSLGLMVFGAALLLLGMKNHELLSTPVVKTGGLAIALGYFVLAVRYWFWLPATALAVACLLLLASATAG